MMVARRTHRGSPEVQNVFFSVARGRAARPTRKDDRLGCVLRNTKTSGQQYDNNESPTVRGRTRFPFESYYIRLGAILFKRYFTVAKHRILYIPAGIIFPWSSLCVIIIILLRYYVRCSRVHAAFHAILLVDLSSFAAHYDYCFRSPVYSYNECRRRKKINKFPRKTRWTAATFISILCATCFYSFESLQHRIVITNNICGT